MSSTSQRKKNRVYVVGGNNFLYQRMFNERKFIFSNYLNSADLVVFTGGEDVSPYLYKENMHRTTRSNPDRDEREKKIFEAALALELPMVGICRGGQFLNVMCGGSMYQDVDAHTTAHDMIIAGIGRVIRATSTHHQMMRPKENEAEVLAYALESTKRDNMLNGGGIARLIVNRPQQNNQYKDPEVVYYEKQKCLCFQPHPEFGGDDVKELRNYFFDLIEDIFEVSKDCYE